MNGSCWLFVACSTLSRTLRKNRLSSSPGVCRFLSSASANGTVTAAAVLGGLVGLGRHRHQRVARHVVHARQARGGRTTAGDGDRARQPIDERIVAAGVEQDDAKLPRLRDLAEEQIERQRLVDQVALALELRIGRQQVVLASHLHAVAGVVDHRHIGPLRLDAELPQRTAQLAEIGVVDLVDLEVQPTKRLTDRPRVVDRIGQFGRMLIRADADHERHAPLRR